jgi:hypothetical protein
VTRLKGEHDIHLVIADPGNGIKLHPVLAFTSPLSAAMTL